MERKAKKKRSKMDKVELKKLFRVRSSWYVTKMMEWHIYTK